MIYQNGQWHVVLTGSESMTYKVTKASDPLRVVVDLPNTLSKTAIRSSVLANEIISTIKTFQLVRHPQPLTRVEIGLKEDTSYKIKKVQQKIWVGFDVVEPATENKPAQVKPAAKTAVKVTPVETGAAQKSATLQIPKEEPIVSSQAVAKESLTPASKILAIDWLTLEEEINFDIVGDGRLDDYNSFLLDDPPRLVVDFFGVQSTEVEDSMSLDGPWVKRIRVATHPKKVRVVFDLIRAPEAKVPYRITLEDDRLGISFKPSSDSTSR